MIPNEENGKEKKCGGLLNQLFSPPKDIDLLQKKCNKRYKTTYPDNDTILVSEACPTFCNFDMCCPIDRQLNLLWMRKRRSGEDY